MAKSAETKSAGPVIKNLLVSDLHGVAGKEVIVSHVTIPPHTTLPTHWHPGEELVYLIEGAATEWRDGKEFATMKAGEAVKVPYKQVHAASTGEEGATILVVRVHDKGQPHRVLVK